METDEATFARAGFARMEDAESRSLCQKIFADALGGHPLISNNSIWRRFPQVWNSRWHHGKYVLIGDALHTAHFSIGSGTRLAMEDAIALDRALAEHGDDVAAALPAFEAARRPIVEKIVTGANASAAWYEHFAEHMELGAGRIRHELHHALGPHRYRAAAQAVAALRRALRARGRAPPR